MIDFSKALNSLCPGAKFYVEGNIGNQNVVWLDEDVAQPTQPQIDAEITRLQNIQDATEYQRSRAEKYPPIGDQLDALWKGGAFAEAMLAQVMAVKAKYPKPEGA